MSDATQAAAPHVATITVRQREVIGEIMRDGADNATVARRLGVTVETVKTHLRTIYAATGMATREELIVALFRGWLKLRVIESRRWEHLEKEWAK